MPNVVATTTPPTLTNGQLADFSVDLSGNLRVTVASGGAATASNITQFGGTNISTGTGTGGAGIPRVTVSSDSFPATQPISGTVTANIGTTGALATDANLDEKFGDLGQAVMAGSAPVVIASNQSAVPVSLATAPPAPTPFAPAAANIISGSQSTTGSVVATCPAGRTMVGRLTVTVSAVVAPAGVAAVTGVAQVIVSGTGATPAPAAVLADVRATAAASAAALAGNSGNAQASTWLTLVAAGGASASLVLSLTNTTLATATFNGYLL